jgi:hypothetical protein
MTSMRKEDTEKKKRKNSQFLKFSESQILNNLPICSFIFTKSLFKYYLGMTKPRMGRDVNNRMQLLRAYQ